MDVIIKIGFESVKQKTNVQPRTMWNGNKLVLAEHVRNLEELRALCIQIFFSFKKNKRVL